MPAYKSSLTKLAQVGKPVYSFGFDNSAPNPVGPAAPAAPTLTANANIGGSLAGNLVVAVQYVYPGSASFITDPQRLPGGFVSANANISGANAVVVSSPSASPDLGNTAIGYNVYAGYSDPLVLINTQVVPIGNSFPITSNLQFSTSNIVNGISSPTVTYSGENVTANATAGLSFVIPTSGQNYTGSQTIGWRSAFANANPTGVNVAIQVAQIDTNNAYVTVDYSTSTTGDYRVISPVNAKFVRAYLANIANGTSTFTSVSIQVN